ncbi:MAG: hypothetical protein HFI35_12955 [Roseburia sp.]|jgi:hypothetical protein|nr:hypothetical protein [Roseburia sp.]
MRRCRGEASLFLYVGTTGPHDPYCPPKEYLERYRDRKVTLPYCKPLTEGLVERLHGLQIGVNCRICSNREEAKRYAGWGVDYITTNLLK